MEAIVTPPPQQLVQLVLQCHARQQLYLLGSTEVRQRTTTVFKRDQPSCIYTSHWFLLSLVLAEEDKLSTLQDKIENTLNHHFVPCTVLVLDVNQFNRWLAEGHPFACTIIRKAMLLRDAGYIVDTDMPATPHHPGNDDTTAFQHSMAQQFFDGALFYRNKGINDLALFMLHQCAEQCLRALLKHTTGWCPHTHNLDKLVRYCSMTVHKVTEIFTPSPLQGTGVRSEHARLYRLLRNAYIDARYKIYVVMEEDMEVIIRKVKVLMKLLHEYKEGH